MTTVGKTALGGLALLVCGVLAGGVLAAGPAGGPAAAETAGADQPKGPELDGKALAELALEHSRARDELLAAEARLALLAEKLYGSRLRVDYRGSLDRPFALAAVELWLDGTVAYRQDFEHAPSAQALKLFDGSLPPGRHVVELRLLARGPGEPADALPAYSAAAGMAVELREKATCAVVFEAEQDGDPPDREALRGNEPEGDWDVEIQARYATGPGR